MEMDLGTTFKGFRASCLSGSPPPCGKGNHSIEPLKNRALTLDSKKATFDSARLRTLARSLYFLGERLGGCPNDDRSQRKSAREKREGEKRVDNHLISDVGCAAKRGSARCGAAKCRVAKSGAARKDTRSVADAGTEAAAALVGARRAKRRTGTGSGARTQT